MSLQSTINKLENCNECLINIATLLCKECNSILCQKCWDNIHNNELKSHNIHKSHSSPTQLVIPIKDILTFIHFNKIIKYEGQFRNGFHDPNDPPKRVSHITILSSNHTTILCDKRLENGFIYEIPFKIIKGHEDGKGCWTMFGVAKDELHGQSWGYNKGGYFFHSYNINPYCEGNQITNFKTEGFKRFQPNDKVTIIADMNRGELGVRVNDISLGIIFNSLPMGVPLYPAISPISKEEVIELL